MSVFSPESDWSESLKRVIDINILSNLIKSYGILLALNESYWILLDLIRSYLIQLDLIIFHEQTKNKKINKNIEVV